MSTAIAIIAAIAAVAAAIAATGSWKAAAKANETTSALAAIELDRRHDELTPDFEITCAERDTSPGTADMRVTLRRGPLERLDEVTITILDETDKDHWTGGLPGGVTQEHAEAFIWGPWEFNAAASAQVISNRTTRPRAYSIVNGKNWDLLGLTRTRPGHWMGTTTQQAWQDQHDDQPLRLLITCRLGHATWTTPYDIDVEPAGPGV